MRMEELGLLREASDDHYFAQEAEEERLYWYWKHAQELGYVEEKTPSEDI